MLATASGYTYKQVRRHSHLNLCRLKYRLHAFVISRLVNFRSRHGLVKPSEGLPNDAAEAVRTVSKSPSTREKSSRRRASYFRKDNCKAGCVQEIWESRRIPSGSCNSESLRKEASQAEVE